MSYCRAIVLGNLVRDPEVKNVGEEKTVINGAVAVNDAFDKDAPATFIDFVLWGKRTAAFSTYLQKGDPILLEGKLRMDRWEKEGEPRSRLVLLVDDFKFVGSRGGKDAPQAKSEAAPSQPAKEGVDW